MLSSPPFSRPLVRKEMPWVPRKPQKFTHAWSLTDHWRLDNSIETRLCEARDGVADHSTRV
jgi:hypothetical protein